MKFYACIACTILTLTVGAGSANAATFAKSGQLVKITVTNDSTLGGCLAEFSGKIYGACKGFGVSFQCSGDIPSISTQEAYRMLDQAQMAFALNKQVKLYINNDVLLQTNEGYCSATKIEVF